jgi:hypothetical protein
MAESVVTGGAGEEAGTDSPVATAAELLRALKRGDDPAPYKHALATCSEDDLQAVRTDRATGLAFWINLYNAAAQDLLTREPGRYDSALRFVRFFTTPAITVAGQDLSLNDIEDGILRGARSKFTLGYTPMLFQSSFVKRYAIQPLETRIHFALNCGAASCPLIRSYDPDRIDEQLSQATRSFLAEGASYDPTDDTVELSRLFLWYRGDFGGGSGIRSFLEEYDVIPAEATPRLRHRDWDETKTVAAFAKSEVETGNFNT